MGDVLNSTFFVWLNQIDADLLMSLQNNFSHPVLDSFFSTVTDLHKYSGFILLVIVPLLVWWVWKERRLGLFKLGGLVFTLLIIDTVCGQVLKKGIARERPFVLFQDIVQKSPASGYSFVSNHAANMAGLAFFLSHFYPRWAALWWGIALIIGLSRVYNGVHFFSDVMAGALVGTFISWLVTRWLDKRLKGNKT
ncbi:MAG: hypothetical protein RJB66_1526 [Pseudomonadota bacterium]|jgi:undecaprenyl-diphosphatase